MPNDKAREIIKNAMDNPVVYRDMARREAEVWSQYFDDPEKERVRKAEQKATEVLTPARDQLRLPAVLREMGLAPSIGLSLGCGGGRAERGLLKQGICTSFHGIDIAPLAVEQAKSAAERENLNATYEIQDLNELVLPKNTFDLVIAQTSLHHVLRLEHVLDEVAGALKPGGLFWVHDYIGESQFQFSDARLKLINDLLAILPETLTYNHFTKHPMKHLARREPGHLVSPFESIRSGEIRPLLLERFDVIKSHEENAFLHRVAGLGVQQNYVENETTKLLYDVLLYFDNLLIEKRIIEPCAGQYLLRPKSASGIARAQGTGRGSTSASDTPGAGVEGLRDGDRRSPGASIPELSRPPSEIAQVAERPLLIHYHIFKNAGTSVDAMLKENFRERWGHAEFERPYREPTNSDRLRAYFAEHPELEAFSSHTAWLPPPVMPGRFVLPIIFMRHPLDRLRSAYVFERKQTANSIGAQTAREKDFAGYVDALLGLPSRQARDCQTNMLARLAPSPGKTELDRAMRAVDELPFVGLVECYDRSIEALGRIISARIPGFRIIVARMNATDQSSRTIDEKIGDIAKELGEELFVRLLAANQGDLAIYQKVRSRYVE